MQKLPNFTCKMAHHQLSKNFIKLCCFLNFIVMCVRSYKKHLNRFLILKNLSCIFNLTCHSSTQNIVAYFMLSYRACSYNQCNIQHMHSVIHRVHRS